MAEKRNYFKLAWLCAGAWALSGVIVFGVALAQSSDLSYVPLMAFFSLLGSVPGVYEQVSMIASPLVLLVVLMFFVIGERAQNNKTFTNASRIGWWMMIVLFYFLAVPLALSAVAHIRLAGFGEILLSIAGILWSISMLSMPAILISRIQQD